MIGVSYHRVGCHRHLPGPGHSEWQAADDGTSARAPIRQHKHQPRRGGILNNGGSLTLDNVIVQSCQALGKGDSVINDHTTLDALGGGVASLTATET